MLSIPKNTSSEDALLFFKVNIAIIEKFLQDFCIFAAGVGNYQKAWKESHKWNLKQNWIRKPVNLFFFQLSDILSVLIKAILKNLILKNSINVLCVVLEKSQNGKKN